MSVSETGHFSKVNEMHIGNFVPKKCGLYIEYKGGCTMKINEFLDDVINT